MVRTSPFGGDDRALPEEFARETRQLMLRRARVGITLGVAILLAFIPVDSFRVAADRYPQAVALRLLGSALLLPFLVATRWRQADRWSESIAGGALVVLVAITAAMMRLFRGVGDPEYAIQGTGIVFCVLGAGPFFPLDARKMLLFGLVALALHAGFTFDFPPVQNFPILFATLIGGVIATVGAHELTRSRLAEFEGRHAKEELLRARSDFVAMLSHDIKNPLAVIDGYVQMMRERAEMSAEERDGLLARVQGSIRSALTLAINFLDASKIEADRIILRKQPIDVTQALGQAVSQQRCLADLKGVSVVDGSQADLPAVDADAGVLDRVFANLVSNAIKHTPPGGTVRVAARGTASGSVEVVVEDTGEGIQPGQESRIFDRYTSAASRADSTGLGLYIARTLTAAHGGTIGVENRQDGPGARFRVTLPALSPRPAEA